MAHVPTFTLVVITLLQLCRAQSSNSTPEWYAANDINDTNFTPKPITELFSTETSFSPEDPIVVWSSSSSLPSNRGIVSSPTPITLYSDSIDNQPPPNVIPLSSTELPSSLPVSQTTLSGTQPQRPFTSPQEASTNWTLSNQAPVQLLRGNFAQNVRQNQPSVVSNRLPSQQLQPRNIQFLLPTQSGNRIFQGQQLPTNGQQNIFILYEQMPQSTRNTPPANIPTPPQLSGIISQPSIPLRNSQQQTAASPSNVRQPLAPRQSQLQPNPIPPTNIPPPLPTNVVLSPPTNNQQQTSQAPFNQLPNNAVNNQAAANQKPDIQQPNSRYQQPNNQMASPPVPVVTVLRRRPIRQRNRVNGARVNRGPNRTRTTNMFPCQGINKTATTPMTTKTQNSVITIRLRPSTISRNNLQLNPITNSSSVTLTPTQTSQVNTRNYERCLNSCRDRKDRICAGPERVLQINPDTLKGFPSMCHMACHNTFRANPIYEKIANGRCGKLRTRIQTVDNSKIRRDDLKKSQYTIISTIPGTVVELAP